MVCENNNCYGKQSIWYLYLHPEKIILDNESNRSSTLFDSIEIGLTVLYNHNSVILINDAPRNENFSSFRMFVSLLNTKVSLRSSRTMFIDQQIKTNIDYPYNNKTSRVSKIFKNNLYVKQ